MNELEIRYMAPNLNFDRLTSCLRAPKVCQQSRAATSPALCYKMLDLFKLCYTVMLYTLDAPAHGPSSDNADDGP